MTEMTDVSFGPFIQVLAFLALSAVGAVGAAGAGGPSLARCGGLVVAFAKRGFQIAERPDGELFALHTRKPLPLAPWAARRANHAAT